MLDITDVCVLISAGAEWRALLPHYPHAECKKTPYGDYFTTTINGYSVCFIHGGWGKIAAAGSTQYAIDRWQPNRLINLGTCGGFTQQVSHGTVILAEKTIVYDIIEQMGDCSQAIQHYTVECDLSWLPESTPQKVTLGTIVSADRDILAADIPHLINKYDAWVADWESGAINWVAKRNSIPCMILRGVSDLVDAKSGEAYGNYAFFEKQCQSIMAEFAEHLLQWLQIFN